MLVLAAVLVLVAAKPLPPPPLPNPNFIVLKDQLDEVYDDDFYCADVQGDIVAEGTPLQAHSCKEPNNDELFETNAPFEGMIWLSDHRLCLGMKTIPAPPGPDRTVVAMIACDETDDNQKWQSTLSGQITPLSDPTLCWTVGAEPGDPSGAGGDHMNKFLDILPCKDSEPKYTEFHMGRNFVGTPPF